MKKLLIALTLIIGLAVTGLAEGHWLQDITVRLPDSGTGFYISNDRILTVAHIIKPYMENAVLIKNGEHEILAIPIKIDREADLALLKVEKTKYSRIRFELDTVVGEKVISVVNFGDFEDIFLNGNVAGYGHFGNKDCIVIDMKIIPGMSGSGVFSDGKLIGIINMLYGDVKMGDFVALIIPAERIKEFLEE